MNNILEIITLDKIFEKKKKYFFRIFNTAGSALKAQNKMNWHKQKKHVYGMIRKKYI